jgi:site-specific recombinase XerD
MPRYRRSPRIENRTNRLKLTPRRKPYYFGIAPGISLGYRRNQGPGTWSVKAPAGHGAFWIKAFGLADDYEAANSGTVLDFWQAQDKARVIARAGESSGDRPITVAEALDNYGGELRSRRGDGLNISRVRRHLPAFLASKAVAILTARDLRHWRDGMLKRGLAPASADRTARALKAALNLAAREDHRIVNGAAWRDGLARLPDAEIARNAILSDDQVRALVAAAYGLSHEFGLWVELHAVTGARTSQIESLVVRDLQDGTAPRLMMPSSLKGRRRRVERKPVPIPTALAKALRRSATGRTPDAPLVQPPGGETLLRKWLKRAVAAAKLDPGTTLYALRHSSIVRMLLAGTPIRVVAVHHDTSVVMIEKNYSRYIGDHTDVMVRRTLLDIAAPKVVPLVRP